MRQKKIKLYPYFLRRYFPAVLLIIKLLAIMAMIFLAVRFVIKSPTFEIKNVTHSGVVKYVNLSDFEKVVRANFGGKNIFLFDTNSLEAVLKQSFQGISTVSVHKKYPSSLVIQVQERVPMAVVKDASDTRYVIDIDGYVLGLVEGAYFDLPEVNSDVQLHVGQFIDRNIVPITLELLNEAKIEDVSISSLSFKPEYSVFYLPPNTPVYFDSGENIKDAIKIVARIVAQATLESKKIAKIDLRYDKVIVLYE